MISNHFSAAPLKVKIDVNVTAQGHSSDGRLPILLADMSACVDNILDFNNIQWFNIL